MLGLPSNSHYCVRKSPRSKRFVMRRLTYRGIILCCGVMALFWPRTSSASEWYDAENITEVVLSAKIYGCENSVAWDIERWLHKRILEYASDKLSTQRPNWKLRLNRSPSGIYTRYSVPNVGIYIECGLYGTLLDVTIRSRRGRDDFRILGTDREGGLEDSDNAVDIFNDLGDILTRWAD